VAVPAGKPAAKPTAAKPGAKTAAPVLTEEQDAKIAYGVTETSLAPRCPHCAYELDPPDAKICLHCGYHMTKRRREARIHDARPHRWRLVPAPHAGRPGPHRVLRDHRILWLLSLYLPGHVPAISGRGDPQDRMGAFAQEAKESNGTLDVPSRHRGLDGRVPALHAVEVHELAIRRLIINYTPPEKIIEK